MISKRRILLGKPTEQQFGNIHNLMEIHPFGRERLLHGNWKCRYLSKNMVKNVVEKLQEKVGEVKKELKRNNPDIWETTNRKIDKIQASLDILNQKRDHILEDMDRW
ncbi:hypothetical protein L3Y34_019444 [Caenorhabditis briggsae]|uniref:Uncharacterized protein n=1 Tax=Caenorhabditis briggsae TaxID=6238 RepID=A0AAE9IW37_CAEBR|nr:hypothetical protein L3Y34_019444 [Caenorhabditis briggsae]